MILALLLISKQNTKELNVRVIVVKCNKDTFMGISGRLFTCVC